MSYSSRNEHLCYNFVEHKCDDKDETVKYVYILFDI